MSLQTIGVGSAANDGTGDPLRTAFQKANAMFAELYARRPRYVAGRRYVPAGPSITAAGVAPGAGSIRLFPGIIEDTITLSALGLRIGIVSAGGNAAAAIYGYDPTTLLPTGLPVSSSANISTASVANIFAAASGQLISNLYWFASNMDNGTAAATSVGVNDLSMLQLIGGSADADLGANSLVGLSTPATFGTWPDLTGLTVGSGFTEVIAVATIPIVEFKGSSVP